MKIGPYHVIQELGRGGMAQVLLAHRVWDDGKRRSCVLKLPRLSVVTDAGILRQFLEESRLAILLRHNNIVSVFDVGVHEGLPYIVMDFVAGKDLAQMVRAAARLATPFDIQSAVHVVREIGQALLHAHEFEYNGVQQRIVHRDVASKNVMVDGSGGVLLMDFGVATSLQTQTSRMHVKGTLTYMAPEHYLGQATAISDVFGLGAIFWELLAGRPFREGLEGQALIAAVVNGTVEPVGRELPEDVRRVLDGMLEPDASRRMTLREVLSILEDYPSRRMALREMMSEFFGRAGKRTGLSQIHFAASKELADTLAVVKVAGVSISGLRHRKMPGHPDEIPMDFVPPVKRDATARVDPPEDGAEPDDDLDDEIGAVPPASDLGSAVGVEPAHDVGSAHEVEANDGEAASDVASASAITDMWRTPGGTVRAPRAPVQVPEQAQGAPLNGAQPTGDSAPSVTETPPEAGPRVEDATEGASAASASTPGETVVVGRPAELPQVPEPGDGSDGSNEQPTTSEQPKDDTTEEHRWSPSGDTLRSPDSKEPKGPPPPATVRLQANVVVGSGATDPSQGNDAAIPTAFLPPPVAELEAPLPRDVGSTSGPEPGAPSHMNAQRFTVPVAAPSGGIEASYELDAGSPPSSPRVDTDLRPVSATGPAARSRGWGLLVAAATVLLVGAGGWFLWPEMMQPPRDSADRPSDSSVAMANTAPVPVTAPSEPATPEDVVGREPAVVEEALAAGAGIEPAGAIEPEGMTGTAMTEAPGLAVPSDEPGPEPSTSSGTSTEPAPAVEAVEPPVDPVVPEPNPAPEPEPAKPAPAPKADDEPSAKAKPRAPKPVPKVDLVVRRGLMVDFAEIRVGRGKAQTVPARGALTVHVAPGNYTLRYRTKADGEWRSLGWTFSSNTEYWGRLELNGLYVGGSPKGGK